MQRGAGTALEFGFPSPLGLPDPLVVDARAITPRPASWFVGRDVTIRRSPSEGTLRVQRIFRKATVIHDHQAVLTGGRRPRTEELTLLCLPTGSAGATS